MPTQSPCQTSAYDYPLLIKQLFSAPGVDQPNNEIVYKGDVRYTYTQFRERVARVASLLIGLGVKPGQTVAVMDWDSHRYLECYFAIPMIGAVLHMVNMRLSSEQLIYTMSHAEDQYVLVNSDFLSLLGPIKGRLDMIHRYVLMSDTPMKDFSDPSFAGEYENLLQSYEPMKDFPDLDENSRATTFYTTGTTGLPKGVYFTQRQLVLHTLACLATLSTNKTQGRLHREDVYMPMTPMFHVHAWGIPYIAYFLGLKQVYPGKYVPQNLVKLIDEEKVSFSHCVPTILSMILKDSNTQQVDLSRWKCIIGGAALPKALAKAAMSRGIDIYAGYGLSETCPVLAFSQLTDEEMSYSMDEQVDLRTRTGRPIALVQIKILDSQGKSVLPNDKMAGEIVVRSPWLTQGYFKDKINSEKLWESGWLHTSDIACIDESGSLRITDRKKDVIKVGGEWVSSLELEDIIGMNAGVSEVAVIAKPELSWGEVPFALVVKKADRTLEEKELKNQIKSYVEKGVLPKEAVLTRFKIVENLEKTSVGKINKLELRKKYVLNS